MRLALEGIQRALAPLDRRYRRVLRAYLTTGFKVVLAETAEFLFKTKFAPAKARIKNHPAPPSLNTYKQY